MPVSLAVYNGGRTIDDKHTIKLEMDEHCNICLVNIDRELIKRAVSNLIQNSINHNQQGCHIFVRVTELDNYCMITVADDGAGAADEQIEKLNNTPHYMDYMACDESASQQRHGLGLLLVKQIIAAHKGNVSIKHGQHGGFEVDLYIPL